MCVWSILNSNIQNNYLKKKEKRNLDLILFILNNKKKYFRIEETQIS